MDLKDYLPPYYLESMEVVNLQDSLTIENEKVRADIEDFKKQFFVSTCTWAISLWEQYVGIKSDNSLSLDLRRNTVIAKLSSQGTCTRDMIISICKNFSGCDVTITDHIEEYYITIEFKSKGNMKCLTPLEYVLEEIKPAYLNFNFAIDTKRDLILKTKVENYNINYNLCGTINCGVEPDVVTNGLHYSESINIDINSNNIDQPYPISGTINTGGKEL